jgi:acyl-CoA thioesterase-1
MRILVALALSVFAACAPEKMDGSAEAREPSAAAQSSRAVATPAYTPTVVFFGTSLTAGYGLAAERAYPAVVARLAHKDGVSLRAVNAGLSGETSAGALRRIDWVLRNPADIVVIEIGANDGLRALDVAATERNIRQLVRRVQRTRPRASVLLVQMEAPPNFGPDYTNRFRRMYSAVACEAGVMLVPFLLEGVAAVPELNQADGLHPNAVGAERIAANVWKVLRPVVEARRTGTSSPTLVPSSTGCSDFAARSQRGVVRQLWIDYT